MRREDLRAFDLSLARVDLLAEGHADVVAKGVDHDHGSGSRLFFELFLQPRALAGVRRRWAAGLLPEVGPRDQVALPMVGVGFTQRSNKIEQFRRGLAEL